MILLVISLSTKVESVKMISPPHYGAEEREEKSEGSETRGRKKEEAVEVC